MFIRTGPAHSPKLGESFKPEQPADAEGDMAPSVLPGVEQYSKRASRQTRDNGMPLPGKEIIKRGGDKMFRAQPKGGLLAIAEKENEENEENDGEEVVKASSLPSTPQPLSPASFRKGK